MTGLSQTTLGRLRSLYASAFVPGDTTSPAFTSMVNQVVERFHADGSWVGAKATYSLTVSATGYITLPYWLESIINARIDGQPSAVKNQQFEFLYNGPGNLDPLASCSSLFVDQGEVPTEVEFPTTADVLTVEISDADDAGAQIRILGTDDDGNIIRDNEGTIGELFTLVSPTGDTTNTFASITGIQKPVTEGRVTIKHGTTTLVTIEPSTTRPLFRRYKVVQAGSTAVVAYCKRRFVPVTAEEDYVFPGNTGAMKMGLYALNYEEKNDLDRADEFWMKAFKLLNDEATQNRGGAAIHMDIRMVGLGNIKSPN